MRHFLILFLALSLTTLFSCVSKKKYAELEISHDKYKKIHEKLRSQYDLCKEETTKLQSLLDKARQDMKVQGQGLNNQLSSERDKIKLLQDQIASLSKNNDNLLSQMENLSIVSKSGAESIKKSIEAINDQSKYIRNLTQNIHSKDSLNLALVMNLKRSLGNLSDSDINIEVRKGVVYVSLSDKMLFRSGSYVVNSSAEMVLGKIAKIVNDQRSLNILVEGHTDNVPMKSSGVSDNWDLSTKRATSIVRILQNKYGVNPQRLTAGGRSEYSPKAMNTTKEGRSMNRRTEIILLPDLEQFFKLSVPK